MFDLNDFLNKFNLNWLKLTKQELENILSNTKVIIKRNKLCFTFSRKESGYTNISLVVKNNYNKIEYDVVYYDNVFVYSITTYCHGIKCCFDNNKTYIGTYYWKYKILN